ncbi:MAG: CRISPR-associated helicase Cas3' [Cyanosarcina radialis HA8281-LM2]|jgi:CRISPR-associated endonuclease/helicase Cas3|nr:CRISPR-associated helicase Cas3' [Cyanosarcina radialis HA8281-LM2]
MSKIPEQLLAKSKPQVTLEEHLRDTEKAAERIFRLNGRWGKNWCRFFHIESQEAQEKFLLNLQVAALFHDIGKANEDFYEAVKALGFKPQTLRHEHLSALVLCLSDVRKWLAKNSVLDIDVITAAVLSHHLKASESQITIKGDREASQKLRNYRWCQPQSNKTSVALYFQHNEVLRILNRIADVAELGDIPSLPQIDWKSGSLWEQLYKQGRQFGTNFKRELRDKKNQPRKALLVAIKAGLIVSDAAASGLVREGKNIEDWIEEVVHSESIDRDDIAKAIINPRIDQIKAKTGSFQLATFQEQIAKQGSKALLLAACGAGKTLGAWKWAEQQSQEYKIGKVIFLYPTRGTATEGFRDYVGWSPATDAALVTGTARYELEAMQENPSEAIEGKDFQADERLYALGFWSRRYFSATVDQFLSFLEHSYQSLCLLPVLADSAVIIDEVHSFDGRMFDSLVSFLENFDIPVLCMTATLPPSRRERLKKAGLTVYPTEADRDLLPDLEEKECHPRYCLEPVDNFTAAFEKAITAYQQGERVLWVVNTVDRCLAIAQKLKNDPRLKELNAEVLTYHSRFRLKDRQKVHAKTIEAFALKKEQDERKPAIAVTTQVCEMSLDLDADVLITEVAPIPSLVQRFGRANRHLARGKGFRASLHTYEPPKNLPYQKDELEIAQKFLQQLSHAEVSQRQFAEALEHYSPPEREADGSSRFLESGYYAIPGSFRDTDEFSVPCILDKDLEAVKAILDSTEKYRKEPFIINVPKKWVNPKDSYPSWLPKYLSVATWEGHYDEESGFTTKTVEEVKLG